jgi:hypothetical protein
MDTFGHFQALLLARGESALLLKQSAAAAAIHIAAASGLCVGLSMGIQVHQ